MHQSFTKNRVNQHTRISRNLLVQDCYAFPLHQVYLVDDRFEQTRSGPNWQGGVMTLTTCKHFMRTTREDWVGAWLAAFTPKIDGENYLLSLMQVHQQFESNYALGVYLRAHRPDVYAAKRTDKNPLGDIYHPKRQLAGTAIRDHRNYTVHPNHVRWELKNGAPKWYSDINYQKGRRAPAALLFDTQYLFSRPAYRVTRPLYRSGWRCTLGDLLANYMEEV